MPRVSIHRHHSRYLPVFNSRKVPTSPNTLLHPSHLCMRPCSSWNHALASLRSGLFSYTITFSNKKKSISLRSYHWSDILLKQVNSLLFSSFDLTLVVELGLEIVQASIRISPYTIHMYAEFPLQEKQTQWLKTNEWCILFENEKTQPKCEFTPFSIMLPKTVL